MRRFLSVFMVILLPGLLSAQTFSARFTSSFYTFERTDAESNSSTYARGYQSFLLNYEKNNFQFNSFGQFENDFSTQLTDDPKVRMYSFYLRWQDAGKRLNVKLGRQPVFAGMAASTIDGLQLQYKIKKWVRVKAYGGGLLPTHQKLELTDDLKNNYLAGAQVLVDPMKDLKLSLSYMSKEQTRDSYQATRADSIGNVFTQFVEPRNEKYQFTSLDARYAMNDKVSFYGRTDFNIEAEKLSRVELSNRYQISDKISSNTTYTFRTPILPFNSIFSFFDIADNHEIETGLHYQHRRSLIFYGNVAGILYDNDNSYRESIGVDFPYGNVNFVHRSGYAGELNGLNSSFYIYLLKNMLMPNIQLSWAGYKLDADESDSENLLALAAGVLYRPTKALTVDTQIQVLNNRYYSNDVRFFFRLQYWYYNVTRKNG